MSPCSATLNRCPTEASADTSTISWLRFRTRSCKRRLPTMETTATTIAAASSSDNAMRSAIVRSIQAPISGLGGTAASAVRLCRV